MEPIKCRTHEQLRNWEENFDIICGLTTMQDSNCGDMEYKQLAHWKDIKEYIGELLADRKNDILTQGLEMIKKVEVSDNLHYDPATDLRRGYVDGYKEALKDCRVLLGKID